VLPDIPSSETPTQPPPTPTPTPTIVYQPAFGIDYTNPEQYLNNGEQTSISSPEVLDPLRSDEKSIAHLRRIYLWLKKEFEPYSAGGSTIGVVTTDQLLEKRRLGGCNDHGLVYVAVVRELGYPAIFFSTNSIAWMELYQAGEDVPRTGHVFVEVYLDGRWVLIDSTNGWYVDKGYDPSNPVIPLKGNIAGSSEEIYGFYVVHKGIDQWDLGIHSRSDNIAIKEEVASQVVLESIEYPSYIFENFKN
jgi:transglutaminase-like putative cysteine protease